MDFEALRAKLAEKIGRPASDDDLLSYLMYPQVFLDFEKARADYDDLSVLPTPAFFYGLKVDEEISAEIEPGKTLFIKLVHVAEADRRGKRAVSFELNGVSRTVSVTDRSVVVEHKSRTKANPDDPREVGAPIPGKISQVAVTVGHLVKKGDPLLTLEAMKMYSSVTAPLAGVVQAIEVAEGDVVDAKDLLLSLR